MTTSGHGAAPRNSPRWEWRVWSAAGTAVVVRRRDLEPGEEPVRLVPEAQIQRWFDEFPREVRRILEALPGSPPGWRSREEMLLARRRLKQAFDRGELALLAPRAPQPGGRAGADQPPPPEPEKSAQASAGEGTAGEKTYFACQLLNEEGKPMVGEAFSLTVTDGSARKGNLDSEGSVYVPRIDPGQCQITFPDIRLNPRKKK